MEIREYGSAPVASRAVRVRDLGLQAALFGVVGAGRGPMGRGEPVDEAEEFVACGQPFGAGQG
ncbi:hypothetical protein [Streptomyces sp. NPDC005408]|uniref:hypothetical protein n=1 Tax=Streptomyces sp. NPDC005408 TaxID=3155341 RepID=UPI0033BBCBC8